jgi:hypothetical protein
LTTLSSHPVIFAENKWKCLSMNNLHTKLSFPSQAQSSPIKVNQGILLCSPHRTNGPISPPFAEAFHFAFPGRQSLGDGGCIPHFHHSVPGRWRRKRDFDNGGENG